MKNVCYVQVPTEEQSKEGISLDNQKAKMEACSLLTTKLVFSTKTNLQYNVNLVNTGMHSVS
jgi:hypothetical protein